jgi:tripartite-type tricarboxylate transporter receptor subunit TctC
MMSMLRRLPGTFLGALLGVAVVAGLLAPSAAQADSIEDFFRGKTVSVILGYPGTGSNGLYARTVAQHIGKHIPGHPTVILRSMPGAGSLLAANHLFNVAPKDGTALGLISATTPLEERLGAPNVKFKAAQFNWIGRVAGGMNMAFVNSSSAGENDQGRV